MSDYLGSLARRARGETMGVRPLTHPVFPPLLVLPQSVPSQEGGPADAASSFEEAASSPAPLAGQQFRSAFLPRRQMPSPEPVPGTESSDRDEEGHVPSEIPTRRSETEPRAKEPSPTPEVGQLSSPLPEQPVRENEIAPDSIVPVSARLREPDKVAALFPRPLAPRGRAWAAAAVKPDSAVRDHQISAAPPVIRVSIGRIEVRAVMAPAAKPAPAAPKEQPLSLKDYLKERNERRRK